MKSHDANRVDQLKRSNDRIRLRPLGVGAVAAGLLVAAAMVPALAAHVPEIPEFQAEAVAAGDLAEVRAGTWQFGRLLNLGVSFDTTMNGIPVAQWTLNLIGQGNQDQQNPANSSNPATTTTVTLNSSNTAVSVLPANSPVPTGTITVTPINGGLGANVTNTLDNVNVRNTLRVNLDITQGLVGTTQMGLRRDPSHHMSSLLQHSLIGALAR